MNPGYVLVNNKDYPQIADDYVRSFKVLRALPCDVFLGVTRPFYDLQENIPSCRRRRIPSSILTATWHIWT